jgi:predicted transposase/invertase (TIGR01784 family)
MTNRLKKLIRFDWAIKNILRSKSNFVIIEGFLSELLKETIKIIRLLECESNQETENDKFNRVDLLVENSSGELIIIEVQNTSELDYLHRLLYGSSKAISENMNLGEPYSSIKKVISVSIVYFDLDYGDDYVYTSKTTFEGLHKKDKLELSNEQKKLFGDIKVEKIFPEYYILKVNKFDKKTKDTLDEWIYFLKYEEIKDSFKAKGLKEAREKLNILKLPKKEQQKYQRYLENLSYQASIAQTINFEIEQERENLMKEMDQKLDEELNKRLNEAEKNKQIKMAKKMKDSREPIEKIIEYTELTKKEIDTL